MEKGEFRLLNKHFLRGKSIKETEEKLAKYYKESATSHGMVHKWFTEFRCGRISTSDAERLGRPKEVTSQEIIDKIHDIVLNDRRLKVRIILIDYLQKRKTITEEYYASLSDRFYVILKEKWPHLPKKSPFPPRQCTISHECHCNGQIISCTLRNIFSSILFPRFGS